MLMTIRRERAAVPGPGHPVRNGPHLDRGQHRIAQDPSVKQVPEGSHRVIIPHVLVHLEHDPRPGTGVDQTAGFHGGKRQRLLRQDSPHLARMSEDPIDHSRLLRRRHRDIDHLDRGVLEHRVNRRIDMGNPPQPGNLAPHAEAMRDVIPTTGKPAAA